MPWILHCAHTALQCLRAELCGWTGVDGRKNREQMVGLKQTIILQLFSMYTIVFDQSVNVKNIFPLGTNIP